jgi:EAL domain-containing protein (putative c-di-GMP-specific phosphodiesterase class I)
VFVSDVYANERSASICRAIITLAHTLGMAVVAEGVENAAQHGWLAAAGCDFVQGFQLARPMTFEALLAFLHAHASVPTQAN